MPSLAEIFNDPNYTGANAATKQAIFDRYSGQDENYTSANDPTKQAIRERFGLVQPSPQGAAPQPTAPAPGPLNQPPIVPEETGAAFGNRNLMAQGEKARATAAANAAREPEKLGYLAASTKAGALNLVGSAAKLVDALNPFTTSEAELATLYKNEPEKLAKLQAEGANTFLQRFGRAMQQGSENVMEDIAPGDKEKYGKLKYATIDPDKAAYLSPVKVVGDVLSSLPTTLALGVSLYLTKGAAARVEAQALAEGLTPEAARRLGVNAAVDTMAKVGAGSEGTIGYAQAALQTREEADKITKKAIEASPEYKKLIADGFSPETARIRVSALAAETSGVVAGAADAVLNFFGGKVLGKVISEGGSLLKRTGKGFLTEAAVEAPQSGAEQAAQNIAVKQFLDSKKEELDGVAEAIAQGFFVGGVSGGGFAAVLGRGEGSEQAPVPPAAPAPVAGSPEQRAALIAGYRTDLGLPLDVATAMADQQLAAAQPPAPAATTATTAPPAATDIPAGVDPQRVADIEADLFNNGVEPAAARIGAINQAAQEAKDDAEANAAATQQEASNATVSTDAGVGTDPSGGGVAAALQQQPGASTEGATDAQSGGVDGSQSVVTQSATGEGAQPGALEEARPQQTVEEILAGVRRTQLGALVPRQAAVSFDGRKGIVFNEAVLGGLRRVVADDDVALDNPSRVGAVMLTGIDRQAGGSAGRASEVLTALTTWADISNERIVLSPAASGDLKQSELVKWYERNGFTTTPDGLMERNPSTTKTITPAAPTPAKPITPTSFAVKEVPAAESPTGKRAWNVTGPDGEILGTFDKKGDATAQAKQARAAARTAAGQQPAGRKATLTPEQRAAATGQRAVTQKASIDATRTAEKLLTNIGTEYTPNPESTQEEAGVEKQAHDERRVAIVVAALNIANDPAHRLNTAGQIAKQVLAHPSVTQRERARAANALREARGEKPIVMDEAALAKIFPAQQAASEKPQSSGIPLGVTSQNSNPKYTTFKNAGQALSWVSRNGTKFEKFLAKRLYYFARKAQIVIASDMNALPEAVRKEFETGSAGVYFKNVIYLHPVYGINNTVFLHEALHGATIAKITEYLTRVKNGESIPPAMQAAYLALETVRLRASDRYFLLKKEGLLDKRMLVFEKGGAFSDLKEFIAYGLSSEDMHEFLLQTSGMLGGKTANYFNNLLSNFVKGIRGIFNMGDTHQSALQDLILATDNLLSTRMRVRKTATAPPSSALPPSTPAKKLKQKVAKVSKAMAQVQASSNAQDVVNGVSTGMAGRMAEDWLPLLKDNYAAFNVGTTQQVLYKLPTSDIIRWKGDEVPGLKRVDTLVQRMAAMRGSMQLAGAKKATELAKFVRKNGQKVLGEARHLARLHEVSPTKYANRADALANDPDIKENAAKSVDPQYSATQQRAYKGEVTKRTRAINEVFTAWEALGKQSGGHSMYKMLRQFYVDGYNLTRTLLNTQIQALPIDAAAKAKLMKSVRLMQEQSEAIVDTAGKKQNALPEEYTPFMRYGENWLRVTAKGGGPAGRAFYTFESGADRNKFQRQEAARLGKDPEDASVFSKGSDLTSLRKDFANESVMLKEMFSAIDKATTSSTISSATDVDAFKEGLKDQLYQVYLLTLPERSLRKQFLNAKNITGFSADIFRNFKTSATKLANQASKLRYATEIQNEVIAARESLAGRPPSEVEKLSLFVNEIAYRANEELNPTPRSKLAAAASQFAFVTILTGAASAMVQFASIPVMVMPRLNRDYGYGKSAAKFARYMPIWDTIGVTTTEPNGDVVYSAPSIGTSKMVTSNPVLQRAFEEAVNRQVTTVGSVSIIANNKQTPENTRKSAVGAAAESAYGLVTGLFSGAERLTREMTYMMAFELEYAKTKDFDASVEKAIEITQDTLFRYDTMERPRILRTGLGGAIGQFKMYAAGMTSFFIRGMYNSMRILNPKEALSAVHLLGGVLLTGAVFHGLAGSPFYSTITTLIDLILNSGDEDEEKKKRRQKNPLTAQSSDLRFRYEFLPEQFGEIKMPGIDGKEYKLSTVLEKGLVSVLTDVNVGSRTSFNNMWFRSAPEGKDWKETAFNIAEANLGPSVSAGGNFISGVEDVWDGKIRRGLEKMVPAFFKGSIVASRYADEGAQTRNRDVILKANELSGLNLAAQVLGFTPTRLAQIQEFNYGIKEVEVKALREKNDLLKDLKDLENNPDRNPESRKKLDRRIDQHNRRYNYMEGFIIDEDTRERSLEAYDTRKENTIRGKLTTEETDYPIRKMQQNIGIGR